MAAGLGSLVLLLIFAPIVVLWAVVGWRSMRAREDTVRELRQIVRALEAPPRGSE